MLLVLLFSSGCTDRYTSDHGKTVFRYNDASGINTLDPAFANDQSHTWICQQLYDGLVALDSSLKIVPGIATKWSILDSGKTYIFTLRDNVYFISNELFINNNKSNSKGRKVTASDFIYSFNRLTDPKIASPGAWVMSSVLKSGNGDLSGLKALNDSTLEIRLSSPTPAFLALLAMPYCSVVPKEVVDHFGVDFRNHPCGTGPFKLAFWKEGVNLVLHRNPDYFEKSGNESLPHLDAVMVSFINDKQSAFIEFLKGNLDMISGLDPSFKDELLTSTGELQPRHRGKFDLQTLPYLNTEYLGILADTQLPAMKSSPLNDLRVRKALSMGFDRKRMMLYLRNNMGTPGIFGMVPPGLPSFSNLDTIGYDYHPDQARALLTEAGYPDGKGLPEIALSTTATYLDLCEYIKSQWDELGIKVKIDVNQSAVHRKLVAEQKLSFFRGSWIADYPDAENYLSLFYSSNAAPSGPNYTHYNNTAYDRLFLKAMQTVDDSLRYSIYHEMDATMMKDAPVIILYYDKVVRLVRPGITGLAPNAMNLLLLKYVRKSN